MKFVFRKFKKQRHLFLVTLFVLMIALIVWSVYLWWKLFITAPPEEKVELPQAPEIFATTSTLVRRPIDGVMALAEEATSSLYAVMLDNFPEARPVAGLSQASLVWEAPVEGGMSRFLAVFSLAAPVARVGPTRSARPYFLDWAKEAGALYLHVGGSNQALKEIKSKEIFDLNEFYRGWYFWRDGSRPRPYNVYTSPDLVRRAWENESGRQNFLPSELSPWLFKEKETAEKGEGKGLIVDFGKAKVEWKYNFAKNVYERWEDGEIQRDESGEIIAAKNVIAQITSILVLDEVGRRQIKTVGAGLAMIYRDGQVIKGTWQRKGLGERTRFFGPDTKEIEFNPGPTWIEVVGSGMVEER